MKNKRFVGVLLGVAMVFFFLAGSARGQQEDPLAEQVEIATYLGIQCLKTSRPNESLQSAGIKNFVVDPNSPTGKNLAKLGFSLKVQEISFFSPDENGMTIRRADKLVMPIPNEWRYPFTIRMQGNTQLPKVEFKGGEIVWDYGKSIVSVKNATFARIKGIEYQYLSGRWKRSPQK